MASITLYGKYGNGKFAIVDEEDQSYLSSFKWHVSERGFVSRRPRKNGKLGRIIYMHRAVIHDTTLDSRKRVYFKNGNKLDLRKSNLRILDMSLNRLLKKFFDKDSCWLWQGSMGNAGYGSFGGTNAHRAVYEALIGKIPEGLTLDHTCHSKDPSCFAGEDCPHRRCVNPSHLEPVTAAVNTMRGRSISALNSKKTHCKRGHPFSKSNTLVVTGKSGNKVRSCKTCASILDKERRSKMRGRLSRSSILRWMEGEVEHGTITAYNQDKCRCSDCKAASAKEARERRRVFRLANPLPDNREKMIHRGEDNNNSKLTSESVIRLRERYALVKSYRLVAIEFGISKASAREAILRKTWRHIP